MKIRIYDGERGGACTFSRLTLEEFRVKNGLVRIYNNVYRSFSQVDVPWASSSLSLAYVIKREVVEPHFTYDHSLHARKIAKKI